MALRDLKPGEVNNRRQVRRVAPGERIAARHSVAGEEIDDSPEAILQQPRPDSPERQAFLRKGSQSRNGKVTATESGARALAEDNMVLRNRRNLKRQAQQKAAEARGRMT